MTEKSGKKKPKKSAKAADASVLGSLRTTRPERIGAARGATATRAKDAAPKTFATPKATAKPKSATNPKVKASKRVVPKATTPRAATPPPADRRPGGQELVTTAVQAAGELGKLGISVGTGALKRVAKRLPKP